MHSLLGLLPLFPERLNENSQSAFLTWWSLINCYFFVSILNYPNLFVSLNRKGLSSLKNIFMCLFQCCISSWDVINRIERSIQRIMSLIFLHWKHVICESCLLRAFCGTIGTSCSQVVFKSLLKELFLFCPLSHGQVGRRARFHHGSLKLRSPSHTGFAHWPLSCWVCPLLHWCTALVRGHVAVL